MKYRGLSPLQLGTIWVIFMVALAVLILVHKTITLAIRPRHAGAEPDEAAAGAEPGAGGDGKEL